VSKLSPAALAHVMRNNIWGNRVPWGSICI